MFIKPNILSALSAVSQGIDQASQRISSGKRINSASDDPIGIAQVIKTKASISATGSALSMLDIGMDRMNARDAVLDSMGSTVMRFSELTMKAASGTNQVKDVEHEMASLEEAMLALANTKDTHGHMFGGASEWPAFSRDSNGDIKYVGASYENTVTVEGVKLSSAVVGSPLQTAFDAIRDTLKMVQSGERPTQSQLAAVKDALEPVLAMRTKAAAQGAAADIAKASLTAKRDRETEQVHNLEDADQITETIRLSEGQRHYEAILKITGMELSRKRLMDYI